MAIRTDNEDEINKRFLNAPLPERIVESLKILINGINYPLAVRSSSILEDSQMLPFAGIYKTYILSE